MSFIVRILITAAALWVAVRLVPGISYTGTTASFLVLALIFGAINAILRPILFVLSLPFLIATLGLFTFVVNALAFWIASALSATLGLPFHVSGFVAAFWGALVVSVVSFALSMFVGKERRGEQDRA
jgi:putative membrane protein